MRQIQTLRRRRLPGAGRVFRPSAYPTGTRHQHTCRRVCFHRAFEQRGRQDVATFLNEYAQQCTTQVGRASYALVDYLTLQYPVDFRKVASPGLPQVGPQVVPELLGF